MRILSDSRPNCGSGDFDSTSPDLTERFSATERLPFPAEKNFTDGELAIEQAIARGATRLVLVGAFGGERTDHALSHLLQAITLAERGLDVVLTFGDRGGGALAAGKTGTRSARGFAVLGYRIHGADGAEPQKCQIPA